MSERDTEQAIDDALARTIRDRRESLKLSQASVARRMTSLGFGWEQVTVYKIEAGLRRVRLSEALALARAIGINLDGLTALADELLPAKVVGLVRRTADGRLVMEAFSPLDSRASA